MGKKQNGAVLDWTPSGLEAPRADVFTAPPVSRQMAIWRTPIAGSDKRPGWFFLAAHGGAGCSLLARLSWEEHRFLAEARGRAFAPHYALDAGGYLPNPTLEPTGNVIVVARTTMAGLARAQELAGQYLAGAVPNGLRLLGLLTVADQPGRLPKELASARHLLGGAYTHTWHIPYIDAYRMWADIPGEPAPATHPAVSDALEGIRELLNPRGL